MNKKEILFTYPGPRDFRGLPDDQRCHAEIVTELPEGAEYVGRLKGHKDYTIYKTVENSGVNNFDPFGFVAIKDIKDNKNESIKRK